MILVNDNVVFESREAIETRVKKVWASNGFNVSFEPYSVAQRLVDVWVELLWNNQETHREFYNNLSINAEGAALDLFIQKLGVEPPRLNFPLLSYVWRNMPSDIVAKRFTFVRIPKEAIDEQNEYTGSKKASQISYKERLGQGAVEVTIPLKSFVNQSRLYKDYGTPTQAGYEEDRLLVIETEVFDVQVEIFDVETLTSEMKNCEIKTLCAEEGIAQPGVVFEYDDKTGAVTYTNSDRVYYELYETDDSLRSRIFAKGFTIAGWESMLNKICARSRVTLERDRQGVLRYKITMIGFRNNTANRCAFFDICDKYLPANFSLFQSYEEHDEAVLITDDSDPQRPRQGFFFVDNPSLLYISGISDPKQINMLEQQNLPPIMSYPTLFIALGNTFTVDLISMVRIEYNDPIKGKVMLERTETHDRRAWISSRSTKERGSYFKAVL